MAEKKSKEKEIEELRKFIIKADESLEAAKKALAELTGEDLSNFKVKKTSISPTGLRVREGGKIIEGVFDGENMTGPGGKVYPVPANYASKSKLVEGDKLKLTVAEDGSFIFKQIGPAERRKIVGTLDFVDNMFHVTTDEGKFNVLYASVTYFKAKPGDKVTIVVPGTGESQWAALENIIHDVQNPAIFTEDSSDSSLLNNPGTMPQADVAKDDFISGMVPDVPPVAETTKPISASLPVTPQPTHSQLETELNLGSPAESKPFEGVSPEISTAQTSGLQPIENTEQEQSAGMEASGTSVREPIDLGTARDVGGEARTGLPEESFLPRDQGDTTNSLGENVAVAEDKTKSSEDGTTELDI